MKTLDSRKNKLKAIKSSCKDLIKQLWFRKEGKVLIISIFLVFVLGITGYIAYRSKNSPLAALTQPLDSTSLTANIDGLEDGSPLSLVAENGDISSIQNGQGVQVAPGKYTLQTVIDGNNGEVKGVKEQIKVSNNEKKQVNLTLKPIPLDESKAVAKALSNPSSIKQILDIKPVEIKNNSNSIVDGSTNTSGKISYPNLILPSLTSDNQDVAALVQSTTAKYSLIDGSKVVLPTQNGISSNSTSSNLNPIPNNDDLKTDSTPRNSTASQTIPNSTPTPSNIPIESSSSLVAQTKEGQVILAQDCEIAKVAFDSSGKILKYFKACDNGQNGFYQYDLSTKVETQVLPTSDSSNQIKVDNSATQNLMVWTKPEYGQFGIIENGKSETILTNTYFTAPTFSPDGKYIIVMDNYLTGLSSDQITALKLTNSNQDQFGLKVKVVSTEDLIKNRNKANFKQVGTTYYIPRPIDYNFDFIKPMDSAHFMAGDSSKIFSLAGEPEDTHLVSDQPGRVFEAANGSRYRLYQNILFNSKNESLVSHVDKVYQLQNKDFYFKVGDFLFRLVGETPVQAYSKPISSVSISNNTIQLILTDGQIVKF